MDLPWLFQIYQDKRWKTISRHKEKWSAEKIYRLDLLYYGGKRPSRVISEGDYALERILKRKLETPSLSFFTRIRRMLKL